MLVKPALFAAIAGSSGATQASKPRPVVSVAVTGSMGTAANACGVTVGVAVDCGVGAGRSALAGTSVPAARSSLYVAVIDTVGVVTVIWLETVSSVDEVPDPVAGWTSM